MKKDLAKNLKMLRREFNAALLLICLSGVGTVFVEGTPFVWGDEARCSKIFP